MPHFLAAAPTLTPSFMLPQFPGCLDYDSDCDEGYQGTAIWQAEGTTTVHTLRPCLAFIHPSGQRWAPSSSFLRFLPDGSTAFWVSGWGGVSSDPCGVGNCAQPCLPCLPTDAHAGGCAQPQRLYIKEQQGLRATDPSMCAQLACAPCREKYAAKGQLNRENNRLKLRHEVRGC